jgi:hypothetical protein
MCVGKMTEKLSRKAFQTIHNNPHPCGLLWIVVIAAAMEDWA